MAFPTPPDSVARLLTFKYGARYMLWNLSEEAYEYSLFDNQVSPPSLPPSLPPFFLPSSCAWIS